MPDAHHGALAEPDLLGQNESAKRSKRACAPVGRRRGKVLSNVWVTASSTWVSVILRGVPGRGSSHKPSIPLK